MFYHLQVRHNRARQLPNRILSLGPQTGGSPIKQRRPI